MTSYTFFIDGDVNVLIDNKITKLEYIKNMLHNTLKLDVKTDDKMMRTLERLFLDPIRHESGGHLPLMYFGHFCDERVPGFVGLHRTPLLNGDWKLHIIMETLAMKSDGENMLLTAWSDYYKDYLKPTESVATHTYQHYDVDCHGALSGRNGNYSSIDILLKRMVGNEIPFDWEIEQARQGIAFLPLENQISLLRALDLQLSNRLDFSEYSRACA